MTATTNTEITELAQRLRNMTAHGVLSWQRRAEVLLSDAYTAEANGISFVIAAKPGVESWGVRQVVGGKTLWLKAISHEGATPKPLFDVQVTENKEPFEPLWTLYQLVRQSVEAREVNERAERDAAGVRTALAALDALAA